MFRAMMFPTMLKTMSEEKSEQKYKRTMEETKEEEEEDKLQGILKIEKTKHRIIIPCQRGERNKR